MGPECLCRKRRPLEALPKNRRSGIHYQNVSSFLWMTVHFTIIYSTLRRGKILYYNLASAQAPSTSCKISFIIKLGCWLYNGRDADMYFALRLDTNMLLKNLRTHTMRWSLHWDGEIKGRVILQMWTPLRCVYVLLLPSVRWITLTMTPHMSPHIYNLARERRMLPDALRLYIAVCPGHHL